MCPFFPMLIWKSFDFLIIMEETPIVNGEMISEQTCISDKNMIHELELKGYGEVENEKLFLKQFETLFLLYSKKLILKKAKKQIDFDTFMNICQKTDSDILTKFLIYRDLRNRGYVVKDGFGFGSDFRVYERGHFGEKGAKFLIFGLNEGQQEKMGNLQKKIEDITQMGKEPIIAVIERRGEVIYYKINRMNFNENKSRLEESFKI
ncbi:tRNA intron endonuclease [Nitrosopumilus adriaticus]|uniref:tRNA intron endonuclease n=2 Tax=Nitrosopumilus adriaticus TaxID=1580092 RepID=A0A0D5C3Y0_9ARCH|nr:tRNA intron endonuclease [Nitrosopumilus adriaticus]